MLILESNKVEELKAELEARPFPDIEAVDQEIEWLKATKTLLSKETLEAEIKEMSTRYVKAKLDNRGFAGYVATRKAKKTLDSAQKKYNAAMALVAKIDTEIDDLEFAKVYYAKQFPYLASSLKLNEQAKACQPTQQSERA